MQDPANVENVVSKDEAKVVWVLPGGGARAVYTAGCSYAAAKLGFPAPDAIIAASGSAGTAYYFIAEQYESIRKIWCELACSKKFANIWRFWKILDLDYLTNVIFKKQEPLQMDKVSDSNIDLYIGLTDVDDGSITYLSKKDNVDLWDLLKATEMAPVFSGIIPNNKIYINGKRYFDTRISARWEFCAKKAIEIGATTIIIFDSFHPRSSRISGRLIYRLWLLVRNRTFRKNHVKYLQEQRNFQVPAGIKTIHIRPKEKLKMPAWGNSKKQLDETFWSGYNDVIANAELRSMFRNK